MYPALVFRPYLYVVTSLWRNVFFLLDACASLMGILCPSPRRGKSHCAHYTLYKPSLCTCTPTYAESVSAGGAGGQVTSHLVPAGLPARRRGDKATLLKHELGRSNLLFTNMFGRADTYFVDMHVRTGTHAPAAKRDGRERFFFFFAVFPPVLRRAYSTM